MKAFLIQCLFIGYFSSSVLAATAEWVELTAYDKLKKSNETHLINLLYGRCLTSNTAAQKNSVIIRDCNWVRAPIESDWDYSLKDRRSFGDETSGEFEAELSLSNSHYSFLEKVAGCKLNLNNSSLCYYNLMTNPAYSPPSDNDINLAYNTNYELRNELGCLAVINADSFYGLDHHLTAVFYEGCHDMNNGTNQWQFGDIALSSKAPARLMREGDKLVSKTDDGTCLTYGEVAGLEKMIVSDCSHWTNTFQMLRIEGDFIILKFIDQTSYGQSDENGICLARTYWNGVLNTVETNICDEVSYPYKRWFTSPDLSDGNYFSIKSKYDGKCLTIDYHDNKLIKAKDCNGAENQQWRWQNIAIPAVIAPLDDGIDEELNTFLGKFNVSMKLKHFKVPYR